MAKKSSIEKNAHRAKLVKRINPRRARLKALARDRDAAPEDRFEAQLKLAELPRNSSQTRVHNRCTLTGRPRGYYRRRTATQRGLLGRCLPSTSTKRRRRWTMRFDAVLIR